MVITNEDKPRKNEISAWTVATGNVDIFKKKSRDAAKFIKDLKGFIGVHPTFLGTLWVFDTKENAINGRIEMNKAEIKTGNNICEVFIDKNFVKGDNNE